MTITHDPAQTGPDLVASMAEVVLVEAAASERGRTMSAPIVAAMWETGLMSHFNPIEAGGTEPGFGEMVQTWIDMARLDGSLGWIGIANLPSAAAAAAYLPDAGFEEVFTDHANRVTLGGQFFPNGTGDAIDDGYRLTGATCLHRRKGRHRCRPGLARPRRRPDRPLARPQFWFGRRLGKMQAPTTRGRP